MAQKFYCKCCGQSFSSIKDLVNGPTCVKSPSKKHELYEGAEKTKYFCKWCGQSFSSFKDLVTGPTCVKSPTKKHEPAL